MPCLDRTAKKLGDGKVLGIGSGETIFKLDSYENNPIVKPDELGLIWYENGNLRIGAVFNGGAELFEDKVILTPRCHRNYRKGKFSDEKLGIERHCLENYISEIWLLSSEDGIHFTKFHDVVIRGDGTNHKDFLYGIEDVRIVKYEQLYLLIGCGKIKPPFKGKKADRIAIYSTNDFVDITYHGIVEAFDSRNAVPFPEYINGKLYIVLRFHPNIHLDTLEADMEQLLNPTKYKEYWQRIYDQQSQNLLLEAGSYPHEKEKIGPGVQPIRTDKGWLLIYHSVGEIDFDLCRAYGLRDRIERGYSICVALLDLEDPRKVLCRTRNPIYIPSAPYELQGNPQFAVDVPAVIFPMGAIVRNDKLFVYCGAGDKYVTLLSCSLGSLVDYLFENCRVSQ